MRNAVAVAALLCVAYSAGAQCLGDFDGNGRVSIDELIISVNNALSDCQGGPTPASTLTPTLAATPTPTATVPAGVTCPIDFSNDNTQPGTPDCYYSGRWNQGCGADDLQTRWISGTDIVVVELLGFTPGLFFGANVTSPTSADLIAWYTMPDGSDLHSVTGTVTLNDSGRTLVVAPCAVPFQIETCDFVQYQGALTDVVQPTPGTAAALREARPAALQRLRAVRAAGAAKPNLERR